MASRALLLRAAKIIEEEAELTRQSCEVAPLDWACADCADKKACITRQRYEELTRCAKELRAAA